MIHLTGAAGQGANEAVVPAATSLERVYGVTRRGWPSSELSGPLLPFMPLNGGAPRTDGKLARTVDPIAALSLAVDGLSRHRGVGSGTISDRATEGAGLGDVTGGVGATAGPGATELIAG